MKIFKIFCFLLFVLSPVTIFAQHVKFINDLPEAGSPVKFTYDPTGTPLAGKDDIDCRAFVFAMQGFPKDAAIKMVKKGQIYEGTVLTTDSSTLVALAFTSGMVKDENPQGYYVRLAKKGIVVAEAYINEAYLYEFFGKYYLGMNVDSEKSVLTYEKGFAMKPELKDKYLSSYLSVKYRINKEEAGKLINENINRLLALRPEQEKNLKTVFTLYNTLKLKSKSDSIKAIIIARYPKGSMAYSAAVDALVKEKSAVVMEQKLNDLIKKFGLDPDQQADRNRLAYVSQRLAQAYGIEKNYDKLKLYAERISNKLVLASFYNTVAWPLAEKNEQTAFAADISKKSIDLIEAAKNDQRPPSYSSDEKYHKELSRMYAIYADTYALLLHNLGKDADAVLYQEKAMEFSDSDGNERYVMYLDLSGNKEKAFLKAEEFLREAKGTAGMKERFKDLYVKKNLNVPFETYMADIEKAALQKEREKWAKKMINIPAPDFSLVNLKGEAVNLSALKGKVVIVDYWATWCGPCVASFPGMQKAVNKYAGNPDVVFLFVNTWQTENNREKLVRDFISEKKFTFNVLFDTKNKQDSSKFDAVSAYKVTGIPTKFIIGPDGNIRFKSVGSAGSADAIVRELDTMITMASEVSSK